MFVLRQQCTRAFRLVRCGRWGLCSGGGLLCKLHTRSQHCRMENGRGSGEGRKTARVCFLDICALATMRPACGRRGRGCLCPSSNQKLGGSRTRLSLARLAAAIHCAARGWCTTTHFNIVCPLSLKFGPWNSSALLGLDMPNVQTDHVELQSTIPSHHPFPLHGCARDRYLQPCDHGGS